LYQICQENDKYFRLNTDNNDLVEITDLIIINRIKDYVEKREAFEDEITYIPCFNPNCNNLIAMGRHQKRDLLLSFQKKYNKFICITCSQTCQDIVEIVLNPQKS
jgi:hypothetical protein